MEKTNPFDETIENMKKTVDAVNEATKDENNNDNNNTDPGYVLYNEISNTSIQLLQNPVVINTFKMMADKLGEEMTKSMVEMFAIMLTQSAYNAVVFYDSLLKSELTKQFEHFAEHLNVAKADIQAHHGVLKVFKKQISDIETHLNISKIQTSNNVSMDPDNH